MPLKFLGVHVMPRDATDGGEICKQILKTNLKSRKELRYDREKHVLLDLRPSASSIVIRPKKRPGTQQDRLLLNQIAGVSVIGRRFALMERIPTDQRDRVFAFETKRKGDNAALLTSLFGSISTLWGAAPHDSAPLYMDPHPLDPLRENELLRYQVQMARTESIKADRARLAAEFRAMQLERECEVLKREKVELQIEMTKLASEMAKDMGRYRGMVISETASRFAAEVAQLKRGVAALAAGQRVPSDEGHTAAAISTVATADCDTVVDDFWRRITRAPRLDAPPPAKEGSGGQSHSNENADRLVLQLTEQMTRTSPGRTSRFARRSTSISVDSGNARSTLGSRFETDCSVESVRDGLSRQRSTTGFPLQPPTSLGGVNEPTRGESAIAARTDDDSLPQLPSDVAQEPLRNLSPPGAAWMSRLAQSPIQHETLEDVVIEREGQRPLGFSIVGGVDEPVGDHTAVMVGSVQEGGAAESRSGSRLMPMDRIVSFNGVNFEKITHARAVDAIRTSCGTVELVVARDGGHHAVDISRVSQETLEEYEYEIEFPHPATGLGIDVEAVSEPGMGGAIGEGSIFVQHISDSGAAFEDGRLRVCDRLIEINGRSMTCSSRAGAVAALTLSEGKDVKLIVSRLPPPEEDLVSIDFDVGEGRLGFSIVGGAETVLKYNVCHGESSIYINRVLEDGSARADGRLQQHDRLLEVNGKSFGGLTHEDALQILTSVGDHVSLKVARAKPECKCFDVVLQLGEGVDERKNLGFKVAGGCDAEFVPGDPSIYVSEVTEGGFAHLDGQLCCLDQVVSINGVDVTNVPHREAVQALKSGERVIRMTIKRFRDDAEYGEVLGVHLACGDRGLGMTITGDPQSDPPGIYVETIAEDGAAGQSGHLKVRDMLMKCNGESLENMTHEEARACLVSHMPNLDLIISRGLSCETSN